MIDKIIDIFFSYLTISNEEEKELNICEIHNSVKILNKKKFKAKCFSVYLHLILRFPSYYFLPFLLDFQKSN